MRKVLFLFCAILFLFYNSVFAAPHCAMTFKKENLFKQAERLLAYLDRAPFVSNSGPQDVSHLLRSTNQPSTKALRASQMKSTFSALFEVGAPEADSITQLVDFLDSNGFDYSQASMLKLQRDFLMIKKTFAYLLNSDSKFMFRTLSLAYQKLPYDDSGRNSAIRIIHWIAKNVFIASPYFNDTNSLNLISAISVFHSAIRANWPISTLPDIFKSITHGLPAAENQLSMVVYVVELTSRKIEIEHLDQHFSK